MTRTAIVVFLPTALCVALVSAASLHDIATRTIPNGLTLTLALAGGAAATIGGYLIGALISAGLIFAFSAFCWRRGWMGGGDTKLLGAAALGMPPGSALLFMAAVALAGGVLAVIYLVARTFVACPTSARPSGLFARVMRAERRRLSRGGPLPYACAIAAGVLFVNMPGFTP